MLPSIVERIFCVVPVGEKHKLCTVLIFDKYNQVC